MTVPSNLDTSQQGMKYDGAITRSMKRKQRDREERLNSSLSRKTRKSRNRSIGVNQYGPKKEFKLKTSDEILKRDGMKEEETSCCICLEVPSASEKSKVNGCSHFFCFSCIDRWASRENSCPLCKIRFTEIDRGTKRKMGNACSKINTKKVKHRDQRTSYRTVWSRTTNPGNPECIPTSTDENSSIQRPAYRANACNRPSLIQRVSAQLPAHDVPSSVQRPVTRASARTRSSPVQTSNERTFDVIPRIQRDTIGASIFKWRHVGIAIGLGFISYSVS